MPSKSASRNASKASVIAHSELEASLDPLLPDLLKNNSIQASNNPKSNKSDYLASVSSAPNQDTLFDQLTVGIIIVDQFGEVITLNTAAENLLQISRRKSSGQALIKLLPGLEPLGDLVKRSLERQQTFGMELNINPPQPVGSTLQLNVRVSPIELQLENFLLVEIVDETQRYYLDKESTRVNQYGLSRRMLRQLAHEIRNPLGGLRGAAQLLEREFDDPSFHEFTKIIVSEADRLSGLVDTLLGPVGPSVMKASNIHEVLESIATIVSSAAPELQLERDYDPSLPLVLIDQNQINQALLNIVKNAAQATNNIGNVLIRTRVRSNVILKRDMQRMAVSVEVEDNGPGVSKDIADTLFYPLVTGRNDGTGLGLPLAQDLVNRHGGLIEYESIPGKTVFRVLLPITDEMQA
ncbi:MAG: nitrogen regulation protein NR(II) [Pseudomonadota bacterium]|nr:nitrogen regulation protein NR(II) [Pseudomonadota bacterium]